MATRDGARFVGQQLASIAALSVENIDVFTSDDGSQDATTQIIQKWAAAWTRGTVAQLEGPKTGNPADNFRSLVLDVPVGYDYVAFADQDDVWAPDKLERAMTALAPYADRPAVYCGRTRLIDAAGLDIGLSPAFVRPPGFRNALVQSLAGGNTMVLNTAAVELVRSSLQRTSVLAHDWWIYMIVR